MKGGVYRMLTFVPKVIKCCIMDFKTMKYETEKFDRLHERSH